LNTNPVFVVVLFQKPVPTNGPLLPSSHCCTGK